MELFPGFDVKELDIKKAHKMASKVVETTIKEQRKHETREVVNMLFLMCLTISIGYSVYSNNWLALALSLAASAMSLEKQRAIISFKALLMERLSNAKATQVGIAAVMRVEETCNSGETAVDTKDVA